MIILYFALMLILVVTEYNRGYRDAENAYVEKMESLKANHFTCLKHAEATAAKKALEDVLQTIDNAELIINEKVLH